MEYVGQMVFGWYIPLSLVMHSDPYGRNNAGCTHTYVYNIYIYIYYVYIYNMYIYNYIYPIYQLIDCIFVKTILGSSSQDERYQFHT